MQVKIWTGLVVFMATLAVAVAPVKAEAVDCAAPLPTQARLNITVNLQSEGTYRLWVRQVTPAIGNQMYVSIDDGCAIDIAKNQQSDKLSWSGANNQAQPILIALDKGEHTIVFAGDQTGIGVDRGLLTTDHGCVPQEGGENCLAQSEEAGELVIPEEPMPIAKEVSPSKLGLALMIGSIVALAGIVVVLLVHYGSYSKRIVLAIVAADTHWARKLRYIISPSTLRHFVLYHRFLLIVYGVTAGAFVVLLVVGAVVAQGHKALLFEMESGEVIGSATKVSDPQASDGWYILFGGSAPVITGSDQTPNAPTPSDDSSGGGGGGTGGGDNGGGSGGGGGGGGGGGTTPTGECPAYPAFPDENCTGWEHTGVTLTDCTHLTDDGYIWDGQQTTFDSCYFSRSLIIQAANVTITRSQVHGVVSTHWSNNYDYRNLMLRDVEIEQEGVEDIGGAAAGGHNYSCIRCNVHHTVTGLHFGDNNTIRDSYVHDFQWREGSHGSGIAAGQGHGSNSLIIHNNIQCNRVSGSTICSSAMSIYPEGPEPGDPDGVTVHNVRVEKNLFNTSGSYCVYAGGLPATNIDFVDNYFGKKFYNTCAFYGPVTSYQPEGGQWVNNIWADGSGPVIP